MLCCSREKRRNLLLYKIYYYYSVTTLYVVPNKLVYKSRCLRTNIEITSDTPVHTATQSDTKEAHTHTEAYTQAPMSVFWACSVMRVEQYCVPRSQHPFKNAVTAVAMVTLQRLHKCFVLPRHARGFDRPVLH